MVLEDVDLRIIGADRIDGARAVWTQRPTVVASTFSDCAGTPVRLKLRHGEELAPPTGGDIQHQQGLACNQIVGPCRG